MLGILQKKGKKGEQLAGEFLQKQGFKIIEKNWCSRWGEIDLIVQKEAKVIFVEVKTRYSREFGKGLEAVRSSKQNKMLRSALFYLQKHPHFEDIAFAVLSIDQEDSSRKVEYLEFPLDGFGRYY